MDQKLVERLASLPDLASLDRRELIWLVANGTYEVMDKGLYRTKGTPVEYLWIVLSGRVTQRVDRGSGPKHITDWKSGQVIGILPYSRMTGVPGDTYLDEKTEVLSIHMSMFPAMIRECPAFTAYTVHAMIDRVRIFNTSDMQDEKMISLGKLSAGLAHELNNPASAALREAKLLLHALTGLDDAARKLGLIGLSKEQSEAAEKMRATCLVQSRNPVLSPIQRSDHQEKIHTWLEDKKIDPSLAAPLSDTAVRIVDLEQLYKIFPGDSLVAVLNWIIAGCTTTSLAAGIERAVAQICDLVDAVKKFTFLGNTIIKGSIDVQSGIRDTIKVLSSKTKLKNADLILEMEEVMPLVYGNGSEVNQVWFSLLDNALDAIPQNGKIRIRGHSDMGWVEVSILDNGPGIAPEVLPRIFDPFFTTKPPGQGTGLGLDIAQRVLRQSRGEIFVNSHPGETEFRVRLQAVSGKSKKAG